MGNLMENPIKSVDCFGWYGHFNNILLIEEYGVFPFFCMHIPLSVF